MERMMVKFLCRVVLACLLREICHGNGWCIVCAEQASCFYPIVYTDSHPRDNYCEGGWCHCTLTAADCSNGQGPLTLRYIPRLPESVWHLDLRMNKLKSADLDEQFFVNASRITHLNLADNSLSYLDNRVLRWMTNLTCLNLDGNSQLTEVAVLAVLPIRTLLQLSLRKSEAFFHLQALLQQYVIPNINIQILRLSNAGFDSHAKYSLSLLAFCPLTQLVELDLSNCQIDQVEYYSFSIPEQSECLVHLERLHLQENYLDGKFSVNIGCHRDGSSMFPNLRELNLSRNDLGLLTKVHICSPKLDLLDMRMNDLFIFDDETVKFSDGMIPSTVTLLLDHQVIHKQYSAIRKQAFENPALKALSFVDNSFPFSMAEIVHRKAFGNNTGLQLLILDGNDFSRVDDDIFVQLFQGLQNLKSLSLQGCRLNEVSMTVFTIFPHLVNLFLRNNKILAMPDGTFHSLTKLTTLDLSQNLISLVDEDTFSPSTRHRLAALYLYQNPFVCSCDLLWFRVWLMSNKSLFYPPGERIATYRCRNIPDTRIEDFVVSEQSCLFSREMNIQIISMCSVAIITLTLISLLFRYRWHIRLMIYEFFRKQGETRRQRLLANHFDYDVFVSFASEQLPWVRQHLMPDLENHLGLRLCIHERDFIPGKNIVDNIADCVESSKKILMVFSRDFVLSPWCQFELTYCLSHVMYHDDVLIIVCVDDVHSRKMTSAMMAVLKTTTYIQWIEQEDAVQSFWGRLHLALHDAISTNQHV